ncbi:Xanthine/uracil/vitamin C permease [Cynara cardunculus var. scolymus]|uniref:Xanthine/uracil/vitamin C permease n=1 Tax=Cynara cardunculus var. scolymus TaxID=59895 RepID=A0A103YGF1_CYNCS|nr:Xanthine/uracil/vitamin C permease [Cynara cardunculus var. scolymus]
MEGGSNPESRKKVEKQKGKKSKIEPFVTQGDHNARDLRSWAKRTGFVSIFSGEVGTTSRDLERRGGGGGGGGSLSPKIETDPTRNTSFEIEPALNRNSEADPILPETGSGEYERRNGGVSASGDGIKKEGGSREEAIDIMYPGGGGESGDGEWNQPPKMKCGIRDNPGLVSLVYYGMQHYLSLAGSLIFIPLIIVPAMGGTDKDTATVISTIMLVSGLTTILHSYFGTRLPLVQGSSFVFLAPALVIINAHEYRNLTENKFRHIMRELQGAIIVSSIFQCILGFSGLMSLFLRLINPVVVAPTIGAVGLAFFSYGFPQAGSCVEISLPQILLVLIFSLHLRGVSVLGHRVPLSVVIIWVYAFFLTAGGAYNYKGCSSDIPISNMLVDSCIKHAYTMKHCRTDASDAWRLADWVRVPYPLQWGIPIFHLRTSIIMIVVSLVASVDSVGTYYSTSMRMNAKPPTRGIVSRGIGLEGFCSVLAGLWGSGAGSTTLTENAHTVTITKVSSRRAVQLGAVILIFFSFVGLSTLRYTHSASFRNIMIVGASLFLGLSLPAYFQQYQPETALILPGYFIPYSAASDGPIHSGNKQFDFTMNALLSMNMVVTLLVAIVLDNTVPGSRQERGVYLWSTSEDLSTDPSSLDDYSLPTKCSRVFSCAKCLGA